MNLDPTMMASLLQSPLIIKNFVVGEEKCNYEQYLLELLNHSLWFQHYHPGGFSAPNSEAHGECDAFNNDYKIDFKLFASKTALRARSVLSHQIRRQQDGVIIYMTSRDRGQIRATRLHAAFRGTSLSELEKLRQTEVKRAGIENDMINALKVLETQKNLLLFFPYEFTFKEPHEYRNAIAAIEAGISNDFQSAFQYRAEKAGEYDTFLCCLYDNHFLIMKCSADGAVLCDSVCADELPTYRTLNDYCDW